MPTILVVDDSPVILRMLSLTLRRAGYTVLTAPNGEEALAWLSQHALDAMIVDLAMPGMDGLTLLRHVRANPVYQDLPIIMLTASGQEQDHRTARTEGANGFLTKPTSSSELLNTVEQVLTLPKA